TKNCCLNVAESWSATVRARMSAAPPGANVLTMRTGRAGHSSAADGAATARLARRVRSAVRSGLMTLDPELVAFAAFRHVEEELVEREAALAQALLLRIGHQPFEVFRVALAQPVFPGILAEDFLLLLPALAIPGKRHDARIFHPLHRQLFRLFECLVEVGRDPGMPLDDLLLDADHVHDREDAGALVERHLLLLVVGKQP